MKVILIGIQGSGKSTQGKLLSEKVGVPYLSTGHIFRNIAHELTPLGRYVKETINAGFLVNDEKTLEVVTDYLKKDEYKNGYILDGFPRTPIQAEEFVNGIDRAVYIKVSDEEALRRLSLREDEGREDETTLAIKKRIELFHRFTEPVIDYYRKKGILSEVEGERSIEEIHQEICAAVGA